MTSNDIHASRETRIAERFPAIMAWVQQFVGETSGIIGRVMLVRVKPHGAVYPHIDKGDYYRVRNRYHLMLSGNDQCQLTCGNESIAVREGLLVAFDNSREYGEENCSDSYSVRLVFDVLPAPQAPGGNPEYKHFALMKADVNAGSLLNEISHQAELWTLNTSRQDNVRVQRETNNIHLRGAVKPVPDGFHLNDWHPTRKTGLVERFPEIYGFVERFANEVKGKLSRLTIVRLNPNSRVYPHIDEGEYYLVRDRYHLVLRSKGGSEMICGDERVVFQEGELWWFDNKAPHEAFNQSDEGRIHVIFDVLPEKPSLPDG
jgi:aspartyl/asparaginyl beta-hydroxylase (cupin superfamily)